MSVKEKIYFQDSQIIITSSKVQIGSKSYVLRNLAAVQAVCLWPRLISLIAGIGCFIAIPTAGPHSNEEMLLLAFAGIILCLIPSIWGVRIDSGGTRSTELFKTNPNLVRQVATAINNALLDLDNKDIAPEHVPSQTSTDITSQLKQFKTMLEEGLISEEDYEKKKNQLLGL